MSEFTIPEFCSTLEQCQSWLEHCMSLNADKSNARFLEKLAALGWQKNKTKIFLVGGTNGKGSTCVFLESILKVAGYKIGCYLSPHLLKITERIRVNGSPVSDVQFCAAFNEVKALYQEKSQEKSINWFEFMTVVAFAIFKTLDLDFLIIEVGIGGFMDVTNTLDPDISIITSIGLDHQDILGETRSEIAEEKSGIFRSHKPAICGDPQPPSVVIEYAQTIDCPLFIQDRDFHFMQQGDTWDWQMGGQHLTGLPMPNLPLINASTALAAIYCLPRLYTMSNMVFCHGLIQAHLPGRWQTISLKPLIIVDVAHNEQGFAYVAQRLQTLLCTGKTRVICAMQDKKNVEAALVQLTGVVDEWYLANLQRQDRFTQRAREILSKYSAPINIDGDLLISYKKAIGDSAENDRIVILGSFYTVEKILKGLMTHEF